MLKSCFNILFRRIVGEDDGDRIMGRRDVLQWSPCAVVEDIVADLCAVDVGSLVSVDEVLSGDVYRGSAVVNRFGRTVRALAVDHDVDLVVVVRAEHLLCAAVRHGVAVGVVVEVHRIVAHARLRAVGEGTLDDEERSTVGLTIRLVVWHGVEHRHFIFIGVGLGGTGSVGSPGFPGESAGAEVRIRRSRHSSAGWAVGGLLAALVGHAICRIGVRAGGVGHREAERAGHVGHEDLCGLEGCSGVSALQFYLDALQGYLRHEVIDIDVGREGLGTGVADSPLAIHRDVVVVRLRVGVGFPFVRTAPECLGDGQRLGLEGLG